MTPGSRPRLQAVRGAVTLDEDTPAEIRLRVKEMLGEMMSRNDLETADIVSLMFTATDDVRSESPATAVRMGGITDVPMLVAREPLFQGHGNIPLCVRVMAHVYTDKPREVLRHAYLRGARNLRSDLPE